MKPLKDEFGTYYLKDGILFFICSDRLRMDLSGAEKISAHVISLQNGQIHPMYIDISNMHARTKQARDFMARHVAQYASRCAFVSKSTWGTAIANFYLTVSKPDVPTKVFGSREKALAFLRSNEPGD